MFTYEIGDKKYYQKKLVLGQIAQLMALLKDTKIPSLFSLSGGEEKMLSLNYEAVAALLGYNLPRAIAIVLIEDAMPLEDKDLDRLTGDVAFSFDAETTMQVAEDFFACNPIASLLERYIGMMKNLKASMMKTGSLASAPSSPEETSLSATRSSGDTLQ